MANHVIPMEITQKIIDKIEAGEEFKVYITIPMFPEGVPDTGSQLTICHTIQCSVML